MGRLYLVSGREDIDNRRKLLGPSQLVEVWQDLYTEGPAGACFWVGQESKRALDSVGETLPCLLVVEESAVPIYYGPRLADVESLPGEESLRARVLSAHGVAVAWATYDRFGERNRHEPTGPTDATFFLRRPRGRAAHLWHLFRTRGEAVIYMTDQFAADPEAVTWAERLSEDFEQLLERFGRTG